MADVALSLLMMILLYLHIVGDLIYVHDDVLFAQSHLLRVLRGISQYCLQIDIYINDHMCSRLMRYNLHRILGIIVEHVTLRISCVYCNF